ncbi:MAG: hypothetical protein AB7E98_12025 [Pirellulales bacterium]
MTDNPYKPPATESRRPDAPFVSAPRFFGSVMAAQLVGGGVLACLMKTIRFLEGRSQPSAFEILASCFAMGIASAITLGTVTLLGEADSPQPTPKEGASPSDGKNPD